MMVKDSLVQKASENYLIWMAITPISGFLSFMLDGIFIGATKTTYMRKAMVQSFIIYGLSMAISFHLYGNLGLWISINIFFVARAITLLRYYPKIEIFS